MKGTDWNEVLSFSLRALNLPEAVREYMPLKPRRWRLDFAWPDLKLGVEIDGATWANGRHCRGAGIQSDCDKRNALTMNGWQVFRFTGKDVDTGVALQMIELAVRGAHARETARRISKADYYDEQ